VLCSSHSLARSLTRNLALTIRLLFSKLDEERTVITQDPLFLAYAIVTVIDIFGFRILNFELTIQIWRTLTVARELIVSSLL
jgi:hypothetical protein